MCAGHPWDWLVSNARMAWSELISRVGGSWRETVSQVQYLMEEDRPHVAPGSAEFEYEDAERVVIAATGFSVLTVGATALLLRKVVKR